MEIRRRLRTYDQVEYEKSRKARNWDTSYKPLSRNNTQSTSQYDRGCFKCGDPHLAGECPKRKGGSSRVAGAQVEIEEEEEFESHVQVKTMSMKVCSINTKEASPKWSKEL